MCEHTCQLLRYLRIGGQIHHEKTLTSSVTTDWRVHWNEDFIARDLLQNFYDANRDQVESIRVTVNGSSVTISAPTRYNLERLFYLGSEKQTGDIGQYGEGFKAAATCLLRDFRVSPVARSDNQIVVLRIAETPVAGTELHPLVYDFFTTDAPCEGTELILTGCEPRLRDSLRAGLTHFFYKANPLLGELLWSSPRKEFAIYASTWATRGCVFYRNLRRGFIPNLPVVLVVNKEYQLIEKQIANDRDRNFFGDKLMSSFYSIFAKSPLRYDTEGTRILLERAQPLWSQGHPLIAEVAHASRCCNKTAFESLFEGKYFARSFANDAAERLQYQHVEQEWQHKGLLPLPPYFAKFGIPSSRQYVECLQQEAREQSRRNPSPAESNSIMFLRDVLRELKPELAMAFDRGKTIYSVAESDTLLGELRSGRDYHSREVFLAAEVFEAEFSRALAVFVHEHAHIYGHDGSRGFTDALTELLEIVISQRRRLENFESCWLTMRDQVIEERCNYGAHRQPQLHDRINQLSEAELRKLLKNVPYVTLMRLFAAANEPMKTS